MASLTDNLPSVSSSARPIDPQNNKGPTFLQGLASIAEQAVTGGSRLFNTLEQDRQREAARAAEAQTAAIKDSVAGAIFDYSLGTGRFAPQRANPEPQLPVSGYTPIDASLEGPPLPPGVEGRVDELVRARAAEDQGRASTGTTQITLEAVFNDLRARFPDQEHVIMDYLKSQGFDHYLFRERNVALQRDEAEVTSVIQGQQNYYKAAVDAGMIPPGTPLEQGAAVGRAHAQWLTETAMAKEAREARKAERDASREELAFQQAQDDRGSASRAITAASSLINPLFTRLNSLAVEALQNPADTLTFEQAVPEFGLQIDQIKIQYRQVMAQNGESESAIKMFEEQMDGYKRNLVDMTSGPLSQFATTKRVFESMQTNLNIDMMKALPVYSGLKEIFGQGGMAELFPEGRGTLLPDSVRAELADELANIRGAIDTSSERVSLANIAALLRGKTGIESFTESQGQQMMPSLLAAYRGELPRVIQGSGNTTAFFNSALAANNAVNSLQPGISARDGHRSLVIASALYNSQAVQALDKVIEQNPQEGLILAQSGRGAATNLFQVLRSTNIAEGQNGWSVEYNAQTGTYRPVLNARQYEQMRAVAGRGGMRPGPGGPEPVAVRTLPTFQEAVRNPPRQLQEHAGSLNLSLSYLVNTRKHDEDFQGVTEAEARNFYVNGVVPRAMRTRAEQEQGVGGSFRTRLEGLREDFSDAATGAVQTQIQSSARDTPPPANELQQTVKTEAEGLGLDWSLVNRLVRKESSWNPSAENSTTQARGLFQINDDVQRDWRTNVSDGLNMLVDAKQGAQRVLGRRPTDAETYVMYQQGPGGGAALLNPSNASKPAVDVLAQAYGGNTRLARQAVTANGGNINMTAAEFARSIMNFFNR